MTGSIKPVNGGRFHPYRRLWATERKDLPVQDVAAAGGWKTVEIGGSYSTGVLPAFASS